MIFIAKTIITLCAFFSLLLAYLHFSEYITWCLLAFAALLC